MAQAEEIDDPSAELEELKVKVLQNMAVCSNNTEKWNDTIALCSMVVSKDPSAKKAFYLRSIAYGKTDDPVKAMTDIVAAIKLDPSDTSLRAHHAIIKQ